MEKNWSVLYKTKDQYQAELLQGMLKENNIESVIINQKDSAYMCLGHTLIFVHNDNFTRARQLILNVEDENPK